MKPGKHGQVNIAFVNLGKALSSGCVLLELGFSAKRRKSASETNL